MLKFTFIFDPSFQLQWKSNCLPEPAEHIPSTDPCLVTVGNALYVLGGADRLGKSLKTGLMYRFEDEM